MSTALDIITWALKRIGVYAPGETVVDADAEDCLTTLNDMIDSWSNESLSCYQVLEQSGVLVPGQQSYTIGPGGNFNVTRPLKIRTGPGAAFIQDTNGFNYLMDVVDRMRWNMIGNRSTLVNSNFPDTLFYDPQYPLGVLNFYPFPNIAFTAFWDSYLQLTEFANLAATLSLPPGYKLALQSNLAVEIWPDFKAQDIAQAMPSLVALANRAKANVKRTNIRLTTAVLDPEITSRAQPTFNIYTYGFNR